MMIKARRIFQQDIQPWCAENGKINLFVLILISMIYFFTGTRSMRNADDNL